MSLYPKRFKPPRIVSEEEFSVRIQEILQDVPKDYGWVTGPGRSGAIAAVYASHLLRIPFLPYGCFAEEKLGNVLLVDTARESGRTIQKAANKYEDRNPIVRIAFEEPPRVAFWYEAPKPQHFRHETEGRPA
jgi:hypothetical protein